MLSILCSVVLQTLDIKISFGSEHASSTHLSFLRQDSCANSLLYM